MMTTTTSPRPVRRTRIAHSKKLQEASLRKRSRDVMVLTGFGAPQHRIFQPQELDRLQVDESYQRLRIASHVNDIIHSLLAGGQVIDPITVAERPNGALFILDGQQRYWAHVETRRPLHAVVYKVRDAKHEAEAFLLLNRHRGVLPGYIVQAWPVPGAAMLREREAAAADPMTGRINFGAQTNRPFQAAALARVMFTVSTGASTRGGNIYYLLERLDKELTNNPMAVKRAVSLLTLLGRVFVTPDGVNRARDVAIRAIAIVAHEKWGQGPGDVPTHEIIGRLRKVNWEKYAPGYSTRFLPMVVEVVKRAWR